MANKTRRININQLIDEGFGKYAKYIIQERALPDVRDGLKPVQRRILYAMHDLGIFYDRPHKKSARSVGEVIGKYHPHGDSSIYEAMVRMSQEWKNNISLLDMHGNKGSIDGDNAAAMRYTECRLSKLGYLMLENIKKNTITFNPNFDDTEKEPAFLPSLLPTLLFNGATGIAAGYATNIPPFNPSEVLDAIVYRIDNPQCTIKKIASIMKGPDFPTKGIIQGRDGILEAFQTGKGKFVIRSTITSENENTKNQRLVIHDIPYETNKANIIKSIDNLIFADKISGIVEVRDESDKNGVCIVVEVEKNKSLDTIKKFLYKNTPLQVSYSINFVAISNKKPILFKIDEVLDAFINHINLVVTKTLQYDLNKANNRLEVLKGLSKAISILDDVIAIIRRSVSKDDAKANLENKFGFSSIQSEAIVQLRLYRLSSTDIQAVVDEISSLNNTIQNLSMTLQSKELLNNYLKDILRNYKKEFGISRQTKIEDEIEKLIIAESEIIDNKNIYILTTHDGYIKATTKKSLESSTYGETNLKTGDILVNIFPSTTLDQTILITKSGQYISIPCHKIKISKYKDAWEHINNIITLDTDDQIISSFNTKNLPNLSGILVIATKHGLIKRVQLNELNLSKNPKASTIINLKNDDEIVSALILNEDSYYEIISITSNGLSLRFDWNEIPIVGKTAAGVKLMKLLPNDFIVSVNASNQPDKHNLVLISNRGYKRFYVSEITKTKRANIGKMVMSQVKNNPYSIVNSLICNSRDILNILCEDNTIEQLKVSTITISDTTTRFTNYNKNIIKTYRDDYLSSNIEERILTKNLEIDELDENDDETIDLTDTKQESLF